jgi:hypothetical protein
MKKGNFLMEMGKIFKQKWGRNWEKIEKKLGGILIILLLWDLQPDA